jgi:hypothetical protein
MIFFLVDLFNKIEQRLKFFSSIVDPSVSTSLQACFKRIGLRSDQYHKEVINYRQVEQVVVDFRSCFPQSFNFQQMNLVL